MGVPVFRGVAGFAADQPAHEIAAPGQALRRALKLPVGGSSGPGANERTPADGEIDGGDQQQADDCESPKQNFRDSLHCFMREESIQNFLFHFKNGQHRSLLFLPVARTGHFILRPPGRSDGSFTVFFGVFRDPPWASVPSNGGL